MARQFGLTGGIGSGKSFIATIFSQMGIPVYISDLRAKALYFDPEIVKAVKNLLGKDAYIGERLNKKFISEKIFNNQLLLKKLNNIIHPAVGKDYEKWSIKHAGKPYLLKESAILIENNLYSSLDGLINVLAPVELRVKRVSQRDHISRQEILNRMRNQTNDEERIKLSDYLIVNCPSHNLLMQIQEIHIKLSQNS